VPDIAIDSQVRILKGPFAAQIGLYQGMRAAERCCVLLALFGSQQSVDIARADVEEVAPVGQANGHDLNGSRRRSPRWQWRVKRE
jgi:hypothetical protein